MQQRILDLNIELEPKQTIAWDYAFDGETSELGYGGAGGGGKSWFAAGEFLIYMCIVFPGTRWLLGRDELITLKRTSLITFFKAAAKHGLKPNVHFRYNKQESNVTWFNESEIILMNMSYEPSDPLYLRFGGLELTGAVVEESNEVSVTGLQILKTRIGRWKNDEYNIKPLLIETFNPDKGHIYHRYYKPWRENKLPPFRKFVRALPTDNPYLAKSYIENLKTTDKVTRERLLEGNFEYDNDPALLMDVDAIGDIFSNSVDTSDEKYMTIDVARMGMDKTVIKCWEGLRAYKIATIPKSRLNALVDEAERIRQEEKIPLSHVIADEDGVGGGVVDFMGCLGFIGNATPFKELDPLTGEMKPSNYQNLRSQCYFKLADMVNKRLIAVECDSEEVKELIIEDLEQIKRKDADKDGKLRVIPKDEIKQKIGRSPDYSDTLMMRMYFEVNKEPEPNITLL
jgi:phage terminase large subunit